jgi:hypothetical protein
MCPAEYEQLFPEHAKAKKVYEKSQIIVNFTDFLRSFGIEACIKHQVQRPGMSVGVYGLVPDEVMSELTSRYFGINLAAYDREEVELRKLRADDHSMPDFEEPNAPSTK